MLRGTLQRTRASGIALIGPLVLITAVLACAIAASAQVKVQQDQDRPFYSAKKIAGKNAPANTPSPVSSASERVEKEGLAVEFSIDSIAGPGGKKTGLASGTSALVSFRVTDSHTGQPVTGLHPNGWISQRLVGHRPNDSECKDKIRDFVGGTFAVRPDIDLNTFYLLTLNSDKTIQVINPQVASSVTKLESYIVLPGVGADWVLSANKEFLYITIPDQSELAVVSTIDWKLISTISTGKGTRPTRAYLDPDGRYVWVGLDGSSSVAVIDVLGNALMRTIPVGAGLHTMAFTGDGRFAYVTNSDSDSVSAIDTRTLQKVADVKTGKTPAPIAYSSASHFIYVVALNGADISVINPATQQVDARIPVKRGVVAFKFEPEGRYGFAVDEPDNQVFIIDSATNSIVSTTKVDKGPIQVNFTRGFAYIRCADSLRVALIELGEVRKGVYSVAYVQVGNKPVSDDPDDIGLSDGMQPTPEGNSAVVANAAEETIYYYVEGMMAPMGTFSNYHKRMRALMVLDRSLYETAPGVYSLPVRLKSAGTFDVPLFVDQPRVTNCFEFDVTGNKTQSDNPEPRIAYEALFKDRKLAAARPEKLDFKIVAKDSKKPVDGLKDVEVLLVEPPGVWQQRLWAKSVGNGTYEVSTVFPASSQYKFMVQVPSLRVRFMDLPFLNVPVYAN